MPKLKESIDAEKDRRYRAEIKRCMELEALDMPRLASILGVSMPTMRKKIREPSTQTLAEARRICKILGIDPELFGNYV